MLDRHRVHLICGSYGHSVEAEINEWLTKHDGIITVIAIQYSYGCGSSTTSEKFTALIHYTETSKPNETIRIG